MMKTKFTILFMLLFSIFLISFVSAEYDWSTYGKTLRLSNSQFTASHSAFNLGVFNTSIGTGMRYPTYTSPHQLSDMQPVSTNFQLPSGNTEYLFFPRDSFIEVYDNNLNLVQEVNSGTAISNLETMDFSNDGTSNDIVGVFSSNATTVSFRVFSFNYTTLTFNKTFEQNFTAINSSNVLGVKNYGGQNAYFLVQTYADTEYKLIQVNLTGTETINTPNLTADTYRGNIARFDVNGDGLVETLLWARSRMVLIRDDGTVLLNVASSGGHPANYIMDSKIFKPDSTSVYKIVLIETTGTGNGLQLRAFKPDGTSYWTRTLTTGGSPLLQSKIAVVDNYLGAGDNNEDLYVADWERVYVITGSTGVVFNSTNLASRLNLSYSSYSWTDSLTTANLDGDVFPDFIYSLRNSYYIYSIANNLMYRFNTTTGNLYSCIPSDINLDGFQEVICTGSSDTIIISSNYTNQNAILTSVSFDPSTVIQINSPLNILVTATDPESDTINYDYQCNDTGAFVGFSTSSSFICQYSSVGTYNVSIKVKDVYHSDFTELSQPIIVTSTGSLCNNNGTCDSYLGETNSNCPSDCPSSTTSTTIQVANGTAIIPTQLVNSDDTNQGLLPEIYYGTLGFLSYVLIPLIVIVFLIFSVLILLAFATIIRNIAKKVVK